jgi:hypothetical protein
MMNRLLRLFKRNKNTSATSSQPPSNTPEQPKKGSKKKWLIGGVFGLPVGGYIASRFLGGDTEPKLAIDTPQEEKKPSQPKTKTSKKQTVAQQLQEAKQDENIVGGFIPELIKLYQLSNALAVQYEQDANAFYQIYQTYEKKLEELLPVITVEMMKTPLSQMTAEDLPSKISTLFRYYSWDFAVQNFPKMLTGYYTLKMYNQKTENLTVNDLIAVADNPALAQNENMILLFQQIGELYKLKMQSALGQIGKLKDIYSFKLQTLKEQANMIKEMVKAILDQEALNFEKQYKIATLQQKERQFNEMMRWRWAQHNLAKQKLEQSLNTLPQINISGDEQ